MDPNYKNLIVRFSDGFSRDRFYQTVQRFLFNDQVVYGTELPDLVFKELSLEQLSKIKRSLSICPDAQIIENFQHDLCNGKSDLEIFLEEQKRGKLKKVVLWTSLALLTAATILYGMFTLFDAAVKSTFGN